MSHESLKSELAEIEAKIKALKVRTYDCIGFASGTLSLPQALEKCDYNNLKAIRKSLGVAAISGEAAGWLDIAIENLEQLTEYAEALDERLWDRKIEIEEALDSAEQTQSEMDKEASESFDRQR